MPSARLEGMRSAGLVSGEWGVRAMRPERVSCNRGVSDQVRELREERDAVKLRAAEAADRAEGHAEQMRGKLARLESGRAALADVLRDVA